MGLNAFLVIGVGASLGAWLRWGLGLWLNPLFPTLPLGTLTANLLGGYVIGLAPEARLLVITGFLGGLTTFSTFSAEVFTLLSRQQWGWGLAEIFVHVMGSVAMTALGVLTLKAFKG
jgi:CrcB protein